MNDDIRHDWQLDQLQRVYDTPLLELLFAAQLVHRRHHTPGDIQRASLLSIKTGGCPEDCGYCAQSAHYAPGRRNRSDLLAVDDVLVQARAARDAGADRFCMGAAWRAAPANAAFDMVLEMVKGVRALGMEACATLGMLNQDQAERLAEAGLTAYNHNLDTSPEYYDRIVTTRSYDDRLETLAFARAAGLQLCCGGIIGMGESVTDRLRLIQILAEHDPHPESVPINLLAPVEGTPLETAAPVDPIELVRLCAVARIAIPQARVRLSAGRRGLSRETQILCFLAGANSIFYGERLLTVENSAADQDMALFAALGIDARQNDLTQT